MVVRMSGMHIFHISLHLVSLLLDYGHRRIEIKALELENGLLPVVLGPEQPDPGLLL